MSLRQRVAWGCAAVIAVAAMGVVLFVRIRSGRSWFDDLGYGTVYSREVATKAALFAIFGAFFTALFAVSLRLASGRWTAPLVAISVLAGLAGGAVASRQWLPCLTWLHGTSFGVRDPQFHLDASFYVFDLPWWHFVVSTVLIGLAVCLAATAFTYASAPDYQRLAAGWHLAILGASVLVAFGVQSWLSRYDIMARTNGMTSTDIDALVPGRSLVAWLAGVTALTLLASAWRREWLYSTVAGVLFVGTIIGVGAVWPAALGRGQVVAPDQHLAATRVAYGLTRVAVETASASVTTTSPDLPDGAIGRVDVGYYKVEGTVRELLLGMSEKHQLLVAFLHPSTTEPKGWWSGAELRNWLGVIDSTMKFDPAEGGFDAPLQRVQRLAPWLTLDPQVYPAVVDGRVVWVLGGYTMTGRYPDSQRASLAAMTTDTQTPRPTYGSGVSDSVNYVRNSVKAIVDARSGNVTFYAWDEADPILKTMRSAFPGLIQAQSTMPPALDAVMRYPTLLLEVQASMLPSVGGSAKGWVRAPDKTPAGVAAPLARGGLPPTLIATYTDISGKTVRGYLIANSDPNSPKFGTLTLVRR